MKHFQSIVKDIGQIKLPKYSGVRIMMMPLDFGNVKQSVPDFLRNWADTLAKLVELSEINQGVGYITIDEADIKPGETHRRPGIHVDGMGGWSGGGGWGKRGMLLVSSSVGCRAWNQTFYGSPHESGSCEHIRDQCDPKSEITLLPNQIYYLNPLAVHESIPSRGRRQFVRLSFPNDAPWYEGYTENPTGVKPAGPIMPKRTLEMSFREK